MPRMHTSIKSSPVNGRVWSIYPTFAADGTISLIRMVWGCAERTFAPGEEDDAITKAGMMAAQALAAIRTTLPPYNDDEMFDLIERFT